MTTAVFNKRLSFYQTLGKLFYAVAAVDKRVTPIEIKTLKSIVKNSWLTIDSDQDTFGTDLSFQIEVVFDWLYNNNFTSEESFDEFKSFYLSNETLFTQEIKDLIWKTAVAIAKSFAKINKSETILLVKLRFLIDPKSTEELFSKLS